MLQKKIILALALAIPLSALATERGHPSNNSSTTIQAQQQGQIQGQIQGQNSEQSTNVAPMQSIDFNNRRPIPAAGVALAGSSSNTTAEHRYLEQRSKTFLWGAFAYNNVDMRWSLTDFVGSNPTPREELAACVEHQTFRQLRNLEQNPCPSFEANDGNPLQ